MLVGNIVQYRFLSCQDISLEVHPYSEGLFASGICDEAICYRVRTMKFSRRAALKTSTLAAAAFALRGSRMFSQAASTQVDAHIDDRNGQQ